MGNFKFFTKEPFIPYQNETKLRLGLSVWPQMRPECIAVSSMDCDMGLELELFTTIATMLNLSLQLKFATKTGCGNKDVNGTWDGLLGMLHANEIDAIGNLCTLDESRSKESWLKYSWPVLQYNQAFLIKAPEPKYFFHIEAPFKTSLWLAIFIMIVLFTTLFTVMYKILTPRRGTRAIMKAVNDVINIISGGNYDGTMEKVAWIVFTCFIGFVMVVYSTFITVAILKPIPIERPFKNNEELSETLSNGKYRLLDYSENPLRLRCYSNETCNKIQHALNVHGYHYFKQPNTINGTNLMLNEILKYDNLVLAKGSYQLRIYLDSFADRSKLWLMKDDSAGEEWSVFFYANDSKLSKLINRAVIVMGDGKENLKQLYFGLSYQVTQVDSIKGKVPEKVKLDLHLITGPLVCYACGMALATVTCITEIFIGRKRFKDYIKWS